jgi:type II secretory pathway predicted ATPase ExeA
MMKRGETYALKAVTNTRGQSLFSTGLAAFRDSHKLSYKDMEKMCGGPASGVSKSSLHRICLGQNDFKSSDKLKPLVMAGVRNFLAKQGYVREEIRAELETIFTCEEIALYDREALEMIAHRAILPIEVQRYFGLKRDPFTGDPRTGDEVFTTAQLDAIAGQLEDAINYQGFFAVLGEIGSGKTILKRRTMETVNHSRGKMVLLFPDFFEMERVSTSSIVIYLLQCFNQTIPAGNVSRAAKLRNYLASQSEEGVRITLGFDECHHLAPQVLTALKNFWEMGSGGYTRYLGLVLFGQPQFADRLREARFRELAERIEIATMPSIEKCAWDYVSHRIKHAGGDAEKTFERAAIKRLCDLAKTPLALGNLANALLIKAHKLGERKVLADFVEFNSTEPRVMSLRRTR